jgi:RNA polymerase sigma-70 factor (ECF subfamily)
VKAAQTGDREAFRRVMETQAPRLLAQARGLTRGDAAAAADLAQETFIEAWRCLGRYHGGCQLSTWLYGILLNRNRKRLRIVFRFPLFRAADDDRDVTALLPDPGPGPDERLGRRDRDERLLGFAYRSSSRKARR